MDGVLERSRTNEKREGVISIHFRSIFRATAVALCQPTVLALHVRERDIHTQKY